MLSDALYLDDGKLVIYRRDTIFYARSYVGARKYYWRSLKTRDQQQAVKAGWKIHHQLDAKLQEGLPVTAKRFRDVIDDYVRYREKDHERGKTKAGMLQQIKRVSRFWKEYAGSKSIHAIDDKDLRSYIDWRRDYYANSGKPIPRNAKLNPADKTLQWEMMLGKAIIKWAHDRGLRGSKPLPTYTYTPKTKRVRPSFELAEYRTLWRTLRARIQTCPNAIWRASRELLRDYVLILANSGMRVGEANNLKIRDVIPFKDGQGRDSFRFMVKGKTGERDVIPRANAAHYIRRVLERRTGARPDDLFFAMPDGSRINTLIDQFNAVLDEGGITHNSHGDKHTLYSLRHFYAVMALRKGIDVYAVARNMGTSIQIIQAYYGKHATPKDFATKLGN